MSCGCGKHTGVDVKTADGAPGTAQDTWEYRRPQTTRPLDQCLFCAQKHADEALAAMNEFMYEQENRSFVHGSIRSVVNHTFKDWPDIAKVARESALLWQDARFKESQDRLKEAMALIDAAILADNPDIKARIDAAVQAKEKPDAVSVSGK